MAWRAARGHNHKIREAALIAQVEGRDFFGLVGIEDGLDFLHKASVATCAGERFLAVVAVLATTGFFAADFVTDARVAFVVGFFAAAFAEGFTDALLTSFAFAGLAVFCQSVPQQMIWRRRFS